MNTETHGKSRGSENTNGCYQKKETLEKLLDHAKKIGMFDRIAVIVELFPEDEDIYVGDLGVRIAADESVLR